MLILITHVYVSLLKVCIYVISVVYPLCVTVSKAGSHFRSLTKLFSGISSRQPLRKRWSSAIRPRGRETGSWVLANHFTHLQARREEWWGGPEKSGHNLTFGRMANCSHLCLLHLHWLLQWTWSSCQKGKEGKRALFCLNSWFSYFVAHLIPNNNNIVYWKSSPVKPVPVLLSISRSPSKSVSHHQHHPRLKKLNCETCTGGAHHMQPALVCLWSSSPSSSLSSFSEKAELWDPYWQCSS